MQDDTIRTVIERGPLTEPEISGWLRRQGPRVPFRASERPRVVGALRILIFRKRMGQVYNLDLDIEQQTFQDIETSLNLHASTLPSFFNPNGACSFYPNYETEYDHIRSLGNIFLSSH